MTSKLTRAELLNIIETDHVQCGEASALARMALAAMDSEPVGKPFMYGIADPDGNAYIDDFCVSEDLGLVEDTVTELNYDREEGDELCYSAVPLYRHSQQATECEQLAIENFRSAMEGIGHIRRTLEETFGGLHGTHVEPDVLAECKAICDAIYAAYGRAQPPLVPSDVLNHLEHEANHVTAWHHMDEHSCKVNRRDLLTLVNAIRAARPAPVVPEEITIETATIIAYGLPTTNIGKIFKAGHDACRAAMLQAGNSPVIGIDLASGPDRTVEVRYVAPPGYVMVPKEPTVNQWAAGMQSFDSGVDKVTRVYKAMLAAAPQEDINALIPLVSRNEQEVK